MLRTTFGRALVLGFIGAMVSIGIVAATPGAGAVGTILSVGTLPAGVKIHTEDLKLKTRDDVQVVTQTITIAPGGHTGWHSPPGPMRPAPRSSTAAEATSTSPAMKAAWPWCSTPPTSCRSALRSERTLQTLAPAHSEQFSRHELRAWPAHARSFAIPRPSR